ncbi:hypothetical protein I5168_12640 [Nonlabens sp. SCSIO 43208]|uniref:hypothetical protein n=1 Tax=Nonlabens sp. SCSIO 43208 TaxID=2793009 RepID=UPI003D6B2767
MNEVWNYTLEMAGLIAQLYANNPKYNNVRVFIPNYAINIAEDYKERLLTDIANINPKSVVAIFIDASHIQLEEIAMQPRIVLHFDPKRKTTDVHLVTVDDAIYKIDTVRMQELSPPDAAAYYHKLSNDTQEYYEQYLSN